MSRRQDGYTLLELLVALVVFGLVLAGLAQAFRFGLTAWAAGARNTAAPEDMAAMDGALTRMIAQARPGSLTGRADGMAFTTRLPAGAGIGGGLADVAIALAPGDDLLLRYRPHPPGIPLGPPSPPEQKILAPGVTELGITYLTHQPGLVPVWTDSWSGGSLPLLVRIHIGLSAKREWPDLVVAPAGID